MLTCVLQGGRWRRAVGIGRHAPKTQKMEGGGSAQKKQLRNPSQSAAILLLLQGHVSQAETVLGRSDEWMSRLYSALQSYQGMKWTVNSLSFPLDFFSQACGYLELQRRYPHLHLTSNLFHLQLSWTESFPLNQPLPLRGPCHFHIGPNQTETKADACESTDDTFAVKVRVSLFLFFLSCGHTSLTFSWKQCSVLSAGSVVFYAVPWGLVFTVL